MSISSSDNSQIKMLAKLLSNKKYRQQDGLFVMEGIHLLTAAIEYNRQPEKIFISKDMLDNQEVLRITKNIPSSQIEIVEKSATKIFTEASQCVLTLMKIPVCKDLPYKQDCVVLENVQDPGNLGTILRTAAATGIKNIILDKRCADVFSPKVLRSAMGANFLLNLYTNVDLFDFLSDFSGCLNITTLSQKSIKSLYEMDLSKTSAWVFGNEGNGVSNQIAKLASYGIKIPMLGKTESLNVAMAASVCLFEQMRQRHFADSK